MLNIIRRHVSWGLKVILGAVIVTFVFFFGYNEIRQADQTVAIKVNDHKIPFAEYSFFYDNQYEQFRRMFKNESGEMPDFILQSVKAQTQRQLVQRVLLKNLAGQMGLEIPDAVLADWIVTNFKQEGQTEFDPLAYKNYLRYFQDRFHLPYETLIHDDLLLDKTQNWLDAVVKTAPDLAQQDKALQAVQWTFEKAQTDTKEKAADLKKLKFEKVGPITVSQRRQLISEELDTGTWAQIFGLSKLSPVLSEPIAVGGKFVWVRFVSKNTQKEEPKTESQNPSLSDFTSQWLGALAQKAEIKVYLPEEE